MHAVAERANHSSLARSIAAGAAGVVAGQYTLIGLGVLPVGNAASGGTPDLLAFGLMAGATFLVAGALLLATHSRIVSLGVAAWSAVVIVAYVAFASLRDPQFEPWGLSVKGMQLIVLAATLYLALREPHRRA